MEFSKEADADGSGAFSNNHPRSLIRTVSARFPEIATLRVALVKTRNLTSTQRMRETLEGNERQDRQGGVRVSKRAPSAVNGVHAVREARLFSSTSKFKTERCKNSKKSCL
jgi:hypothetical protein